MPTPRPLPSLVDVQNLTSANSEHASNFHVIKIPPLYSNTTNSIPKEAGGVTAEKYILYMSMNKDMRTRARSSGKQRKAGEGEKTRRSARRQPADARDAANSRQARSHCTAGRRRAERGRGRSGRGRSARAGGPGRHAGGNASGDARSTGGDATGTKARASATDQRPTARRGPGARPVLRDRPPAHAIAAGTGARTRAGATAPVAEPRQAARPC